MQNKISYFFIHQRDVLQDSFYLAITCAPVGELLIGYPHFSYLHRPLHTNHDYIRPNLEIALYQYGNDNLSSSEGYIQQVLGFSGDLDEISEKLFSLNTNGGEES